MTVKQWCKKLWLRIRKNVGFCFPQVSLFSFFLYFVGFDEIWVLSMLQFLNFRNVSGVLYGSFILLVLPYLLFLLWPILGKTS